MQRGSSGQKGTGFPAVGDHGHAVGRVEARDSPAAGGHAHAGMHEEVKEALAVRDRRHVGGR